MLKHIIQDWRTPLCNHSQMMMLASFQETGKRNNRPTFHNPILPQRTTISRRQPIHSQGHINHISQTPNSQYNRPPLGSHQLSNLGNQCINSSNNLCHSNYHHFHPVTLNNPCHNNNRHFHLVIHRNMPCIHRNNNKSHRDTLSNQPCIHHNPGQ